MAGILVFVEQRNGELRKASFQAISEAKRQAAADGWPVTAVLPGHQVGDLAATLGAYGATKVLVADDPALELYSCEGYAAAVAKAAEMVEPEAIFFSATSE